MIGASKILTVSYGTFSCTLEGFDEPFSTMKAIAEYFRDLAADDRYFGAEPPTPDAEMLHRIAEREIQRRVEAKINENGVVLRQTDLPQAERVTEPQSKPARDAHPSPAQAQALAPALASNAETVPAADPVAAMPPVSEPVVEDIPAEAPVLQDAPAHQAAETDAVVDEIEPEAELETLEVAAESEAAVESEIQPEAIPDPVLELKPELEDVAEHEFSVDDLMADARRDNLETLDADDFDLTESEMPETLDDEIANDSVAAKLQRIRAVVEGVRATAPYEEDEEPTIEPQAASVADDFGFELDLGGDVPELRAAEAARAKTRLEDMSSYDDEGADEEPVAEMASGAEAQGAPIEVAQAEDSRDEDAQGEDAQGEDAQGEDGPFVLDPAMFARDSADTAAVSEEADAEKAVEEGSSDDAAILAKMTEMGLLGSNDQPSHIADEDTASVDLPDDEALSSDDALTAQISDMADDSTDEDTHEAEPIEAEPAHPSLYQRARARVIRLSKSAQLRSDEDFDLADTQAQPDHLASQDLGDDGLTNGHDDADTPDHHQTDASEGRAILEATDEGDGGDVSRLMDEAKAKLEGAENRRKFSAISHLKAAVAATLADRKMHNVDQPGPAAEQAEDDTSRYRDDLSKAVRPRRPTPESGTTTRRPSVDARPAPLVLVSEQRVDHPDTPARDGMVVRPRRISSGNLAVSAFDDDEEDFDDLADVSPESVSSFAEFADRLGASNLTELLEAAAAYTSSVEGHPHFSRPQLLRKVAVVADDGEFNREDGLRSFGMLLREGKIQKVSPGQFTINDTSKFMSKTNQAG